MQAIAKNNERNYDIRNPLARYRRANSIGHSRHFQNPAIYRPSYVSRSDWALHRSRRLGRWGVYSSFVRFKFLTPWDGRPRSAHGKHGRIWSRNAVKNLAWCEMKKFLIEQIPVLFFIAAFFMMLALGGG